MSEVHIIGGGLAGSEAAWHLANNQIPVILHEMRPVKETPAHKTDKFAELVCSNSFRSDDHKNNAVGILHEELRISGSIIMKNADKYKVPAGSALAVDRELFSENITKSLKQHPLISILNEEIKTIDPNWENVIICTGPLTSENLTKYILESTDEDSLYFFDAIAPIIYKNSINMDICWAQSRYDKIGPTGSKNDYINCPFNKEEYYEFVSKIIESDKINFKDWEKDTPYFDSCLPIEIIAQRGIETLRHGPMKPFGLKNIHKNGEQPYAVVQLRQDDMNGNIYNMVGFQTKMKYNDQINVLKTIPGLSDATFARLGGIHRNTYINSPNILNNDLTLLSNNKIRFAGQITGVEGYVESTAIGFLSAIFLIMKLSNKEIKLPPTTTAMGSLLRYITRKDGFDNFQPMNINFGLFDEIIFKKNTKKPKRELKKYKKEMISKRSLGDFKAWHQSIYV